MLDSFGRSIDYLRISVTDRCNLRCVYCMPEEGITLLAHDDILSYEEITEIVKVSARLGFTKIRLTGGEPLVRKGIVDLVAMLSQINGINTLAMTTNGTLLEQYARELKLAGLMRINVSLDTLDPELYKHITRGGSLERVIAGIEAAQSVGLAVKINTVILDPQDPAILSLLTATSDYNTSDIKHAETYLHEQVKNIEAYAQSIGAEFQRIAQYRLTELKKDYQDYERPPACASCNRLRLLADGTLRPCLHSALSVPVDFSDIENSIRRAVSAKPARGQHCEDLEIGQIGG